MLPIVSIISSFWGPGALPRLTFFKRRNKRKEKEWGEAHGNSARNAVLSRPFLTNIAFALVFYSPSFSIRCFQAPETYCIRGKHLRKYGILSRKKLIKTTTTLTRMTSQLYYNYNTDKCCNNVNILEDCC